MSDTISSTERKQNDFDPFIKKTSSLPEDEDLRNICYSTMSRQSLVSLVEQKDANLHMAASLGSTLLQERSELKRQLQGSKEGHSQASHQVLVTIN